MDLFFFFLFSENKGMLICPDLSLIPDHVNEFVSHTSVKIYTHT